MLATVDTKLPPWPSSSHILSLRVCSVYTCKQPHSAVHEFQRFKPVFTSLQSKDFTEPSSQLPFCMLMVADNLGSGWQFPPVSKFPSVCQLSGRGQEWSQRRNLHKQFTSRVLLSLCRTFQPAETQCLGTRTPIIAHCHARKALLSLGQSFAEKQMVFPFLCHRL